VTSIEAVRRMLMNLSMVLVVVIPMVVIPVVVIPVVVIPVVVIPVVVIPVVVIPMVVITMVVIVICGCRYGAGGSRINIRTTTTDDQHRNCGDCEGVGNDSQLAFHHVFRGKE
jgi:hypothetical protein